MRLSCTTNSVRALLNPRCKLLRCSIKLLSGTSEIGIAPHSSTIRLTQHNFKFKMQSMHRSTTMSYNDLSIESFTSICSILACKFEGFADLYYDNSCPTELLCEEALAQIEQSREALRGAHARYRLDELLIGMIQNAPHLDGKRYVAVALHIAKEKGLGTLIKVARAWLEKLFIPILKVPNLNTSAANGSLTPTSATTYWELDSASSENQTCQNKVAHRERHRCAITHTFSTSRRNELFNVDLAYEITSWPHTIMAVAYIIPFSLNDFCGNNSGGSAKFPAETWEMFRCWTQLATGKLARSYIDSPSNAIYMTYTDLQDFDNFHSYLDKDVSLEKNKYRAKFARTGPSFSNGKQEADVAFPLFAESDIEPPDPELIAIHAAFAKVLHQSGVVDYSEGLGTGIIILDEGDI